MQYERSHSFGLCVYFYPMTSFVTLLASIK
jgi:hypothetical protein